jgi:ABC-2 type transport system ATP-binding protein
MIELQNCTKSYGDLIAVQDLSLKAGESQILGLLGPNGAGKSTAIKMMVGLIIPDTGSIRINGYDISKDPLNAKKSLAYVPEKGQLYEKLTAWEFLTFIGGLYGMNDTTFRVTAEEYLKIFGIYQWRDELIENFSFGMKQKLLLTSSFMRKPRVMILDEPHNGLDPKGIRLLKDILHTLKQEGVTILFSTHIISLSEQLCDRVVIMNKGTVAAEGTRDDLRSYARSGDRTLEDIFLHLTSDYEK